MSPKRPPAARWVTDCWKKKVRKNQKCSAAAGSVSVGIYRWIRLLTARNVKSTDVKRPKVPKMIGRR